MKLQIMSWVAAITAMAMQLVPAQPAEARHHHHYYNNGYAGYGNPYGGGYGNGYGYGNVGYGNAGGYGNGYHNQGWGGYNHRGAIGYTGAHRGWR